MPAVLWATVLLLMSLVATMFLKLAPLATDIGIVVPVVFSQERYSAQAVRASAAALEVVGEGDVSTGVLLCPNLRSYCQN